MFSLILDCPECNNRFNFDNEGNLPEFITCPQCRKSKHHSEYSTIVFCSQCGHKLRVPLGIDEDARVQCSVCGSFVKTEDFFSDDADAVSDNETAEHKKTQLLEDGAFFSNYKITRLIGKGGMAEVYLAEHLLLKKACAIKVMRNVNKDSDPVFIKRFVREAKLSHRFSHPNIVKVLDAGCDFKTGYMFIVMEYVQGVTLLELSNADTLSEQTLREVLEAMAVALKVLKENNIVHRDIKPSNIMKTVSGAYKLMDLGIAKIDTDHQAGEMTLTIDKQTIGTPSYASPEQCQSAHSADIRSDIYSLGATLYHLASGKVPYDGTSTIEIILNVMKHEHVPLRKLRKDISPGFVAFIEKMMSLSPEERPASPDAILEFVHSGGSQNKDLNKIGFSKISSFFSEFLSGTVIKKKIKSFCIKFVIFFVSMICISLLLHNCKVNADLKREKQNSVQILELENNSTDNVGAVNVPDNSANVSAAVSEKVIQVAKNTLLTPKTEDGNSEKTPQEAVQKDISENRGVLSSAEQRDSRNTVSGEEKTQERTIQFRLDECRRRLAFVRSDSNDRHRKEKIAFIKRQIEELDRQLKIRKQVIATKRSSYSKSKTGNFKKNAEMFCNVEIFNDYGFNLPDRPGKGGNPAKVRMKKAGVVVTMFLDNAVDPNVSLHIQNPMINKQMVFAEAVARGYFKLPDEQRFADMFSARKVDVNLVERSYITRYDLFMLALEDIDSGEIAPLMQALSGNFDSTNKAGSSFSFVPANNLLLLAPKLDCKNKLGETPMHIAAKYNDVQFAKNLLYAGFTDFMECDNNGKTPWDIALERGSFDILEFLKANKFSTSDEKDKSGMCELFSAIKRSDYQKVSEILKSKVVNANEAGFNELTAFEYACFLGDIKMVYTILASPEHGVKYVDYNGSHAVDQRQQWDENALSRPVNVGATHPLHIAFVNNDHRMFEYLLKCGASSNIAFPVTASKKGVFAQMILNKPGKWTELDEKTAALFIKSQVMLDQSFNINLEFSNENTLSAVCQKNFRNKLVQIDLVLFLITNGAKLPQHNQNYNYSPEIRSILQEKEILK